VAFLWATIGSTERRWPNLSCFIPFALSALLLSVLLSLMLSLMQLLLLFGLKFAMFLDIVSDMFLL
jgi:hypothetical protein